MQIKSASASDRPVAAQQQERAAPPTFFHQSAERPRAQIQTRFRKKAGREIRRDGQKKWNRMSGKNTHAAENTVLSDSTEGCARVQGAQG